MNAKTTLQPTTRNTNDLRSVLPASAVVIPMPIRHIHRERDFGVGYGNSSGYATQRRYSSEWAAPRFRFA